MRIFYRSSQKQVFATRETDVTNYMGMVRTISVNNLVEDAMLSYIPNVNSEDHSEIRKRYL